MEKMCFSAPPGSVCKRQFLIVTVGVLDVKSFVEHDGEVRSLESVPFLCNVLRILIESTDSMICRDCMIHPDCFK